MMLAGKLEYSARAPFTARTASNFYGTQIQLMQSAEVRRSAEALVRSTHPEMQPVPVEDHSRPKTAHFDF